MRSVFILTVAVIVSRLAASFFPALRVWGLNQAAFVDGLWLLYPVLLAAAAVVYWYGMRSDDKSVSAVAASDSSGWNTWAMAAVLISVMGGAFFLLSVKAHFLGDGLAIVAVPDIIDKGREYGEMLIHRMFLDVLKNQALRPLETSYRLVSVLSGIGFVATIVFYAGKIVGTSWRRYAFVAFNLLSAVTLQYYGYIENYSVAISAIYITVLSAAAALRQGRKSIVPLVSFAAAVFLHGISLVYLPAIALYIGMTYSGADMRRRLCARPGLVLMTLAAGAAAVYAAIHLWGTLYLQLAVLPLWRGPFVIDNYYLPTPPHLVDMINLVLLVAPVAVIMVLLSIMTGRRKRPDEKIRGTILFFQAAALSGFCAAIVIEPKLGMARDWDLMSTMLVGAAAIGPALWIILYEHQRRFFPATILMLIMSAAVFVPWLALHQSTSGLYAYTLKAMTLDPQHARSGFYALQNYRERTGDFAEAKHLDEYSHRQFPELDFDRRGTKAYREQDYATAERLFRRAAATDPQWFAPYRDLGLCYLKTDRPRQALEMLRIADGLNPYSADVLFNMGQAYQMLGNIDAAVRCWVKSRKHDSLFPWPNLLLGEYHLQQQRPDSALFYLTGIPDSTCLSRCWYDRGMAYLLAGDTVNAAGAFQVCSGLGGDTTIQRAGARMMLTLGQAP